MTIACTRFICNSYPSANSYLTDSSSSLLQLFLSLQYFFIYLHLIQGYWYVVPTNCMYFGSKATFPKFFNPSDIHFQRSLLFFLLPLYFLFYFFVSSLYSFFNPILHLILFSFLRCSCRVECIFHYMGAPCF